jgi:hypothetical protein
MFIIFTLPVRGPRDDMAISYRLLTFSSRPIKMSDNVSSALNLNIPERPQTLVNSSSVVGYTYLEKEYSLLIWFKGPKQSIYLYRLVYPPMFSQVFSSGSQIGKKVHKVLGQHPYRVKLR